ncbi:hydratase [Oscillibacter hominis]|uniref:Hydratase n=1 Tax=Oscillibacter hominis TaxID=2763056 RepID=A0A7G9B2Z4_9FIRM|nr:nitrilase-related carbon-nitrogen hydrolase [Oscillibacter hominis]QNL43925.1 hydratase [Oscillibacter hominis]
MEKNQSPARVACVQMDVVQGQVEQNLATARRMVEEACAQGATLMVLPELFNTGCVFDNRAQVFAVAEPVPGGQSTALLLELAKAHGVYIVASLVEQDGPDLFNTAVLAGPEGLVGKFRKLHPCEDEVYWIEPGNLGLPVFHTPIGRIGLLICLDAYYPETFRILAMQGADVICVPFNAGDVKESRHLPDPYYTMASTLCMANALSNHVLVVGTDRVGRTGSVKFAGQSVIADQWGAPIAGPAGNEREEILYADVDLCDSRRKYFHPTNSRLANRRTDVYSADLGYCPEKYRKQ